ncbi:hypothetical protein GWI33_021527 [Rhynchophorus ferrugineus]|uniref:Uncharacterized protein n=1 Tax=Rhynchophorus ferrugineus TaxID=354439 RepID=A0A834HP21_RHYFE|nr:hypothetical protein GWI33_021527 [Rhynchophorus ferrugineus]
MSKLIAQEKRILVSRKTTKGAEVGGGGRGGGEGGWGVVRRANLNARSRRSGEAATWASETASPEEEIILNQRFRNGIETTVLLGRRVCHTDNRGNDALVFIDANTDELVFLTCRFVGVKN